MVEKPDETRPVKILSGRRDTTRENGTCGPLVALLYKRYNTTRENGTCGPLVALLCKRYRLSGIPTIPTDRLLLTRGGSFSYAKSGRNSPDAADVTRYTVVDLKKVMGTGPVEYKRRPPLNFERLMIMIIIIKKNE